MENVEDLIVAIGGFGRFQLAVCVGILPGYCIMGWSLMQLSFTAMEPEWNCHMNTSIKDTSGTLYFDNMLSLRNPGPEWSNKYALSYSELPENTSMFPTAKQVISNSTAFDACYVNGSKCTTFIFEGPAKTIIEEFDLVCDLKWVKQLIMSIQMVGLLFGSFLSGQLSDVIGRKGPMYGFFFLNGIVNVIAGFSINWYMYAVCIFFLGFFGGGFLVAMFPHFLEFMPAKWRPVSNLIPSWQFGTAVFAGFAYLFPNWSHLHLLCALFHVPFLFGWFYFPESPRWLAAHGRVDDAMQSVEKIARMNKRPIPPGAIMILDSVAGTAQFDALKRKYSYLDLFVTKTYAFRTIMICLIWMSTTAAFYGISFGVSSLGGNVYLDIMLMAVTEIPLVISTFFLMNKFGRKSTAIFYFILSLLLSGGCLTVKKLLTDGTLKTDMISGLSLTTKSASSAAFCVMFLWSLELYPTVTRNLLFGIGNVSGRIGGIFAPYALNFDDHPVIAYIVLIAMMFASTIVCFSLPETNGRELPDMLRQEEEDDNQQTSAVNRSPNNEINRQDDRGSQESLIKSI